MPIATINPATGETLETFDPYTDEEVERRLSLSATAAATLRFTPIAERLKWISATADILDSEVESVARMITVEMGKPSAQAEREVRKCVHALRFYADHAEGFLADEPLSDPSAVGATRAWTTWQPLGTVLAVMPWNFPLWQVMRFAIPALSAGNAGLLKHSSNVPRSALYLGSVFERGGFPLGAFQTLLVESSTIANIIGDARIAAVTVTGSEMAGQSVATAAGKHLKKSVLELGGSDPFIVMADADVEAAATVAVKARVQNSGQSCIAAKRFIVHADVYDDFMSRFVTKMEALVVGDPLEHLTDVGPLATESGRHDIAELVDDAVSKGAQLVTGGRALDRPGWFYAPTVLAGLNDDMRIVSEEAFGPVASIYRAADREEALRIANQTQFGLSSAVWTTNSTDQDWFVEHLDAGAVFINGMSQSSAELPFGGVKSSGHGREMASAGIREFCNLKAVWSA